MFKFFFLAIALAAFVYALSGFISGEIVFGSTSKINGREIKLVGWPAILFCLAMISASLVMAGIGASQFGTEHTALFERIAKISMIPTLLFFLGTAVAALLK